MSEQKQRIEKDSMGEVSVPAAALYGAQTQRAVDNFPISGLRMPRTFLRALGLIKAAAATVNKDLGLLDPDMAAAIETAANEVAAGIHDAHFPIDVFQTGSGTSTNMNANEVVASLAGALLGAPVHPNDHVNMCQSSNDVIPTAIHVSACIALEEDLLPALEHLTRVTEKRATELDGLVKTGRTHLMDAMPVRMGQELGGWASQLRQAHQAIAGSMPRLQELALGGSAVGTGINTHPEFGARVAATLAGTTGVEFVSGGDYFAKMSSQDAAVEMSGQLRLLAVCLMKIANDLRWMNSGPQAGIAEISSRRCSPAAVSCLVRSTRLSPRPSPWCARKRWVTTRRLPWQDSPAISSST